MSMIGILVSAHQTSEAIPSFSHQKLYEQFCKAGARAGIMVVIFRISDIDWSTFHVNGFQFDAVQKQWIRKKVPMPALIYDRYFPHFHDMPSKQEWKMRRKLLNDRRIRFLSRGLSGKFDVYAALRHDEHLRKYVPECVVLQGKRSLTRHLQHQDAIVIKPDKGTHGKGVLVIDHPHFFQLRGRDLSGQLLNEQYDHIDELYERISTIIRNKRYLIQPYLRLQTNAGDAYDLRVFMQKNDHGHWIRMGSAVRQAAKLRVISNLHAGGRALPALPFLTDQFGEERASRLLSEIHHLCRRIPPLLEARYGRLFELGIDIGIDRLGQIWILEVNSKPGRGIFTQLGSMKTRKQTILNPICYARNILNGN